MKLKYTAAITPLLFAVCLPGFAGPFGLQRGMTKDQVIAPLGRDAVTSDKCGLPGRLNPHSEELPKARPRIRHLL